MLAEPQICQGHRMRCCQAAGHGCEQLLRPAISGQGTSARGELPPLMPGPPRLQLR